MHPYDHSHTRRKFLAALSGVAAAVPLGAFAQERTGPLVRVIVPYSAGSGMDIIARLLSPKLQSRRNQAFIVENIPGASGNIGAEVVAKSAADGHTIMVNTNTIVATPSLYAKLPFDVIRSFAPITMVAFSGMVLVVHKDVPVNNLDEFLTWVRSQPGKLNYGSPGIGTQQHLAMELMKQQAHFDIVHVPYKTSAPAYNDLIAGIVPTMFVPIHAAVRFQKAGRIKIIGCSLPERFPLFPDIPTLNEFGLKGFDVDLWYGVWAPAGTPANVLDKYNREIGDIVAQSDIRDALANQGLVIKTGSRDEFARMIKADTDRWGKVIREARITAE